MCSIRIPWEICTGSACNLRKTISYYTGKSKRSKVTWSKYSHVVSSIFWAPVMLRCVSSIMLMLLSFKLSKAFNSIPIIYLSTYTIGISIYYWLRTTRYCCSILLITVRWLTWFITPWIVCNNVISIKRTCIPPYRAIWSTIRIYWRSWINTSRMYLSWIAPHCPSSYGIMNWIIPVLSTC